MTRECRVLGRVPSCRVGTVRSPADVRRGEDARALRLADCNLCALREVAVEAGKLCKMNKKKTLTSREVRDPRRTGCGGAPRPSGGLAREAGTGDSPRLAAGALCGRAACMAVSRGADRHSLGVPGRIGEARGVRGHQGGDEVPGNWRELPKRMPKTLRGPLWRVWLHMAVWGRFGGWRGLCAWPVRASSGPQGALRVLRGSRTAAPRSAVAWWSAFAWRGVGARAIFFEGPSKAAYSGDVSRVAPAPDRYLEFTRRIPAY